MSKPIQNNAICYFAKTNFRDDHQLFGIKAYDRLHHCYIIGRSGAGKSTLIHTKVCQDLKEGNGLCLIDFHGDLYQQVLRSVPTERKGDLVLLDSTNPKLSLGYNLSRPRMSTFSGACISEYLYHMLAFLTLFQDETNVNSKPTCFS